MVPSNPHLLPHPSPWRPRNTHRKAFPCHLWSLFIPLALLLWYLGGTFFFFKHLVVSYTNCHWDKSSRLPVYGSLEALQLHSLVSNDAMSKSSNLYIVRNLLFSLHVARWSLGVERMIDMSGRRCRLYSCSSEERKRRKNWKGGRRSDEVMSNNQKTPPAWKEKRPFVWTVALRKLLSTLTQC